MAGSKKLVFIPSIRDDTWLLMSQLKDTVHFRDYADEDTVIAKSTSEQVGELLADCEWEAVSDYLSKIPMTNIGFWKQKIELVNRDHGLVDRKKVKGLQHLFKDQCYPFLNAYDTSALREIFVDWMKRFDSIVESDRRAMNRFNHWDDDDPLEEKYPLHKGIAWTAHLLENSRQGGSACWIPTGDERADFSLVSMELNLGLSSKSNDFNPGARDSIVPDGLGLRRDGRFTVFEVKGPHDEKELADPLIQATCGALAVLAKRDMLCTIARAGRNRRPAIANAKIPKSRPSIGIHILTAKYDEHGQERLEPWTADLEKKCQTVLSAFPELEYIAYSFVVPNKASPFGRIDVDQLVAAKS